MMRSRAHGRKVFDTVTAMQKIAAPTFSVTYEKFLFGYLYRITVLFKIFIITIFLRKYTCAPNHNHNIAMDRRDISRKEKRVEN